MNIEIFGAGITLLVLVPLAAHFYVQRLPQAPLCPDCRAVTREISRTFSLSRLLSVLAATSRGECNRCGWSGRMRWKWAARSVRGDG